jgi:hypothetical protein
VAGLLLGERGARQDPPVVGDVAAPQSQQVTPAELAVDGEVEGDKLPGRAGDLKANADRPVLLELEWGLGPDQPPLVPGGAAAARGLHGLAFHWEGPLSWQLRSLQSALRPHAGASAEKESNISIR